MSELVQLITPTIVLGLVLGIMFAALFSFLGQGLTYRQKLRANILPAIGYSLPVVALGYTIGYLASSARSGDLSSLIPPVMTLVGGVSIYAFGLDMRNKVVIGYCVFVFSLIMLYGVYVGTAAREVGQVNHLISLSETEKQIRIYRENRDLPADFPAWMLGDAK
jgi:hypothetical protein